MESPSRCIADLQIAMMFGVLAQLSENPGPNFRGKPAIFLSIIDLPTTCGHLAEQGHGLRHCPGHASGQDVNHRRQHEEEQCPCMARRE